MSRVNSKYIAASPEESANEILQDYFNNGGSFPVDPFKILKDFRIRYTFINTQTGFYIQHNKDEANPIIGANYKHNITRIRFSIAHELGHHILHRELLDKGIQTQKNIESEADRFASQLLMPLAELQEVAYQYVGSDGYVQFDDIHAIADYFGVSFDACLRSLAWKLHLIDGDTGKDSIKRKLLAYKPDKSRIRLGLDTLHLNLYEQLINSYTFSPLDLQLSWYDFLNDTIHNECHLEGIEIELTKVAAIAVDIRYDMEDGEFRSTAKVNIAEAAGLLSVYNYIANTEHKIHIHKILNLQQFLFQYTPHAEEYSGKYKDSNNMILGSSVETSDYLTTPKDMNELQPLLKETLSDDGSSVAVFIRRCAMLHHRLTKIHPFLEGNGRLSRAFLNWMFRLRGLPPISIKPVNRQEYIQALTEADKDQKFDRLTLLFINALIQSSKDLNKMINPAEYHLPSNLSNNGMS